MENALFVVSKLFRSTLASPLFLLLLGAAISLFILGRRATPDRGVRRARRLGFFSCALLALISLPVFVRGIAVLWEFPLGDPAATEAEVAAKGPYDAIVVLGGSVLARASAGAPASVPADAPGLSLSRIQSNDSAERLVAAAALYRAGAAPRVIASGGSGLVFDQNAKEGPYMAALLQLMGIPDSALIVESGSRNTYENALRCRAILQAAGADRVILVTSAWHMRRAEAVFRKAGVNVTPYAVDSLAEPLSLPADLVPGSEALDRSTRLLREMAGYVAYRALGRL